MDYEAEYHRLDALLAEKDAEVERLKETIKAQEDEIGLLTVQLAAAKAPEPPTVYETATDVKPYTGGDSGITAKWEHADKYPRPELPIGMAWCDKHQRAYPLTNPPRCPTCALEVSKTIWGRFDKDDLEAAETALDLDLMEENRIKDARIGGLIDLLTRCRGAVKNDWLYWRQAKFPPDAFRQIEIDRAVALLEELDKVIESKENK